MTARRLLSALLLVLGLVGCTGPSATPTYAISGQALAGPTCPVQPASPSPGQCAPRPVAGAELLITDAAGHEVGRVTTGVDGAFATQLPVGSYTITPQRVVGLLGTARPIQITISAGGQPAPVLIEYDTGIR